MSEKTKDDLVIIWIHSARMKRITGWVTDCRGSTKDCGTTVTRNKRTAQRVAVAHARAKHEGLAELRERQW